MAITVEVRGGNLEKALRVLKKKVLQEGIKKKIMDKKYFSKPSEIKREKAKERSKVIRKAQKTNAHSKTRGQTEEYSIDHCRLDYDWRESRDS